MNEVLFAFGFCWMIIATVIGLTMGAKHDPHLADLQKIAEAGDLLRYHQASQQYKAGATVHGHSFLWSVIMVVVSLALPKMAFPPLVAQVVPYVLMIAAPIWTVAAIKIIRPLMIVADLGFFLAIITVAVGLIKAAV